MSTQTQIASGKGTHKGEPCQKTATAEKEKGLRSILDWLLATPSHDSIEAASARCFVMVMALIALATSQVAVAILCLEVWLHLDGSNGNEVGALRERN